MIGILYNIRSLHNVGSIFRTADGAGVEKLYLCGITPTPLDEFRRWRPQLTKVALGAEKTVSWEYLRQTKPLLKRLRSEGFIILGLERVRDAVPYTKAITRRTNIKRLAILVGHERRGVPKSLRDECDIIAMIPMHGRKESLNVAVSFGVAAFEAAKYYGGKV